MQESVDDGMRRRLFCGWMAAGSAVLGTAPFTTLAHAEGSAEAPLPTAAFAQLPRMADLDLSPSGQFIAGLLNIGDNTALIVRHANGGPMTVRLKSDNELMRFGWVRWVSDSRLLVGVVYASSRDFVHTTETRLLAIDREAGEAINLVPAAVSQRGPGGQFQDHVLDWLPQDGKHVLLQLMADGTRTPAVYEVDVVTARRRQVQAPLRDVWSWWTDAKHRVRLALRSTEEGRQTVLLRDGEGGEWRPLWTYDSLSPDAVMPLGFGLGEHELYVKAQHEGRSAVFTVDVSQPTLPRTLVASHPRRDVTGRLLYSPKDGRVVGLRSSVEDGQRSTWWDPQWRKLLQLIDEALPERHNRLLELSADERRYLVYSSGNGVPGEYYLGDRTTGELSLLASNHPGLPAERLAGKKSVELKARDGLDLEAYLTLPRGAARGARPLVLMPHGGPHYNDVNDFDVWSEFLAARGYAVLQVNFRGSTGYGHDFFAAGLRQWGLRMQDDLTDAVQWAIGQGITRAGQVGVVGGSYGGYAALMGAVKTPTLYRCAVGFAGVYDLLDLWDHTSQYVGGNDAMRRMLGERWGDRDRLRQTSPALQARHIACPVLLVHGSDDRVVPVDQSRDMAKALRSEGKSVRYVELKGGDHHLGREVDRSRYFEELERFLAEHLPRAAVDAA
jgi:dipeptidyl aminopeptidase/acylaminoacyl peptidase